MAFSYQQVLPLLLMPQMDFSSEETALCKFDESRFIIEMMEALLEEDKIIREEQARLLEEDAKVREAMMDIIHYYGFGMLRRLSDSEILLETCTEEPYKQRNEYHILVGRKGTRSESNILAWWDQLKTTFSVFVCAVTTMVVVGAPFSRMQRIMLMFWAILMSLTAFYSSMLGILLMGWHVLFEKQPPHGGLWVMNK